MRHLHGIATAMMMCCSLLPALDPPTREQLERYRRDGSLQRRIADARRFGNHRVSPFLVEKVAARYGLATPLSQKARAGMTKGFGSMGVLRTFAILVAFSDYPGQSNAQTISSQLFGNGIAANLPYDGLRSFYLRSSYGQLDLQGTVLGWYTTDYRRSSVEETTYGREELIQEVIAYYDSLGHDFSQYDNDDDGAIDYFLVLWSGPWGEEWATFWWGYSTMFYDTSFVIDGKTLHRYSWQAESRENEQTCGSRCIRTVCHETAHAMGLPDYYDYEDLIGPRGGVGRIDLMGGPGGHCAFSKLLLGWVVPQVYNEGTSTVSLAAADGSADVALVMHGDPQFPFGEYFLVENRRRQGNYVDDPGEGLLIWHVDARLSETGELRYDNSFTEHKLLRLMEADGLEEIEQGLDADADDYYTRGDLLRPDTVPSSDRYDGSPTNVRVSDISELGSQMSFRAALGSGCAVFCEASVLQTSWPGNSVLLDASATWLANCDGTATFAWTLSDGTISDSSSFGHSFPTPGSYSWSLQTERGAAWCQRSGSIRVCRDDRCWVWQRSMPMTLARSEPSAIVLADGRVLVAGNEGPPEIYDPESSTWTATGPLQGIYSGAQMFLLEDERVLITGSTDPESPVNAEIYDPARGAWQVTGQMVQSCFGTVAAQLEDGQVLVAGGLRWLQDVIEDCRTAELFDPVSETWRQAGVLTEGGYRPGLTALADGRALLTGYGEVGLFNPQTMSWSWSESTDYPWRGHHLSVRLHNDRVLVAGGFYSAIAEVYIPASDRWSFAGSMQSGRVGATATVLPSGRVLVCGGSEGGAHIPPSPLVTLRSVEMYNPASRSWLQLAPLDEPRFGHAAVLLNDGTVLVIGGMRNESNGTLTYLSHTSVERYAPFSPDHSATTPRRVRRWH